METTLDSSTYARLLALARRLAGPRVEAEDLLQDALTVALRAQRPLLSSADGAWLRGVLKNLVAMQRRGEHRRRRREADELVTPLGRGPRSPAAPPAEFLAALPKGLSRVAKLILTGHTRGEIRYLLRISDEALRRRLTELRRHWAEARADVAAIDDFSGLAPSVRHGPIRQALLPVVRSPLVAFASHDPDGHLIAFRNSTCRPSRNPQPRQQKGGRGTLGGHLVVEITHRSH